MEHPQTQTGVRRRHDPSYQGRPIFHFPPHPSIKQNELPRHREGPLASPLQNLFLFNGLPCHPLPSNLFLSCLHALPRAAVPFSSNSVSGWQNATGPTKWLEDQRKELSWQEGRKWPQTEGAGLADVGFAGLPPGFYWGKKLVKVRNPPASENSERSRRWWQGESTLLTGTQTVSAPCTQLGD